MIRVNSMISAELSLLLSLASLWGVPAVAQEVTTEPDEVRLEVDDLRRLAQVLRSIDAGAVQDTAAVIEREYLAHASPGLRAYAARYGVTGEMISSALAAHPSLYADLDGLADAILAQEHALQSAFHKLQELYPDAVFPPIWFFAGGHGTRGLTRPEGALICAEGFTGRPEDVVPLVLHELAHFQQAMVQGVDVYRRVYGPEKTLLALALREGSADLIANLTTGRHTNAAGDAYGLTHEPQLWSRFRQEMHRRDPGDWMFVQPSNVEWPPNLGYWIGYRIAQNYYEQAQNKRQAILDILGLTDFDAFLQASGYAEHMGQ